MEDAPSDAPPIPPALPSGTWTLEGPAPQPAAGEQRFAVDAPRVMSLDVVVQDVAGRRVRSLHHGTLPAGHQYLRWDGRDEQGRPVASGVYWIHATDGRASRVVKSVRVR